MRSTLVFFSIMAVICGSSCGEHIPDNKVPSVVQNTLKARFSNALNIEWEWKKGVQLFEAEFHFDKNEYSAYIDAAGKMVMHKTEIMISEIPVAVVSTIQLDYRGYEIDDAEKLEKDHAVYYQVELEKKGEKVKKMVFSEDGRITDTITFIN